MRADSETAYLDDVCRIIVQDCRYAMVWIGLAENDPDKSVRPVASAGFDEGYIQNLRITWADAERGRGPTGTAIRTGEPCGCANMRTVPGFAPWRAEALKRGYASSLSLPLLAEGRAFGAITLYSSEVGCFSPEDTVLLAQLAEDVSYGIAALRVRRAQAATEQALRESNALHRLIRENEERYRSLVTATAQIVWTTDPQGRVVDQLPGWQSFTGQSPEEYKGTGWADAVHPDDRERALTVWSQAVNNRSLYEVEYRLRHHSGQYRYVYVRGVPVLEAERSIREWVGTCTDISDRKEAERRREFTNALLSLFAEKHSLKDYLDAVTDILRDWSGCQAIGIRLVDSQREIPYESFFGFDPAFLALEHRLSLERDNCCCIRAVSQNFEEQDQPLLTPGGSYLCDDSIKFVDSLSPEKRARYRGNCMKFGFASLAIIPLRHREKIVGAIHLADARPGRFPPATVEFIESMTPLVGEAVQRFQAEAELANYRDRLEHLVRKRTAELEEANVRLQTEIAERRRAQESLQETARELERSNRDLEQFAYVASHDLQEPLRAVGGYVRLLQRRFPEALDPKALEFITGAADGATRMERLIIDLLAYSRVGTATVAATPTSLDVVLREALHNLQASITSNQAAVTSDPLPTLVVDPTQMVQLFQNLLGNAFKFRSAESPLVHVAARPQDNGWVFSVRDNGIGIEPQYFERIFHIFQRLHTRTQYPGTGIGLAICKKIVERHGGHIWVESRRGQGATFSFSIPQPSAPSPTP